MKTIKLPVFVIEQPIGKLYIGKIEAKNLYKMSKVDRREIKDGKDYIGIQRPLDLKHVSLIKKYLKHNKKATFPNSIILFLNKNKIINYDNNILEIVESEDTFIILDGQHRLSGFEDYDKKFELAITILTDLEENVQAEVFMTINTTQVKVNRSLAFDLKCLCDVKMPEKMVRTIAFAFNSDVDSPWYQSISILGVKDELSPNKFLTLDSFAQPIVDKIYDDKDFYELKDYLETYKINYNEKADFNLNDIDLSFLKINTDKYILWEYYKSDKETVIYKILLNYFNAIRKVFPSDWKSYESILSKTTGYNALMKLFDLLFKEGIEHKTLGFEYFYNKIKILSNLTGKLRSDVYGGSGEASTNKLFNEMKKMLKY